MHLSELIALIAPGVILVLACVGGARLFGRLEGKVDHAIERVNEVEKQFKPNGGSSLKDDMNRLKGDVRDINTKFDAHTHQHNGQW